MIRREISGSPQGAIVPSALMKQNDNPSLSNLFVLMDVNGDGKLTRKEFTNGILAIEHWDITEIEVSRMFDSIDVEEKGYMTRLEFQKVT
jgi:Ca2+-binding EF-hand superfamily protein